MSALQNQPLLFRQLACAALEMKDASCEGVFDVLGRVADDIDRAGFPEFARHLSAIIAQGRGNIADATDDAKALQERIEELEGELAKAKEKLAEKAGEKIRDAATEWVDEHIGEYGDDILSMATDDLKRFLTEEIAALDAEDLLS